VANDRQRTLVAQFTPTSPGIIRNTRPAALEIFPVGEHMVETIIVTFIYIERLRDKKEEEEELPL
jgi:hypothetical protein